MGASQQLSESQQNHYIWEVFSVNRRDALKTATPTPDTDQQNGLNSFPWQCPTTHLATSASEVKWTGLWSFASSAILTRPLANYCHLFKHLKNFFCRKNAFTTSRMQKMLSKSSSNPKAQILCYRKKQTYFSLVKLCWL